MQTPGAVCLLCLVLQIFLLCYSTCLIYANLTCEMSSVLCTMTNNSRHLFRNMTAMRKTLYFCWIKEQITIFAKFSWTFIQQRLQTITDITWSPTQCLWFDILDIVLSTNCREWMNKIQAVPNCVSKKTGPLRLIWHMTQRHQFTTFTNYFLLFSSQLTALKVFKLA